MDTLEECQRRIAEGHGGPMHGSFPEPWTASFAGGVVPLSAVDTNPRLRRWLPAPSTNGDRRTGGGDSGSDGGSHGLARDNPTLGLRDCLLMHGRQPYGQQTCTELKSLSFVDWTLQINTGLHKDELCGHFEAADGARIVMYDVNVYILPFDMRDGRISPP